MGDRPHKPLPKLRTFQIDQALARGETPIVAPPKEATVKTVSPKPAPKIIVAAKSKTPKQKTSSTPAQPPAFHELKKSATQKIEHIVAESKPSTDNIKTVTVRNKTQPRSFSIPPSNTTIITASKKSEFKLIPSILSSLKTWLGGFGSSQNTPTYTVSTVDRRKGVIQKATTKSGAIFTTDPTTLKQGIIKNREDSLKETPPNHHLSWSPNTESPFPLIEEPHHLVALPPKTAVVVEYKKKTFPAPEVLEPAPSPSKRIFVPPPVTQQSGWETDAPSTIAPDSPYQPSLQATPSIKNAQPQPLVFKVPAQIQQQPLTTTPAPPVLQQIPLTPTVPLRFTKPGTSIPNKPNPRSSYLKRGLRELFRFDTTVATVVLVGSLISFVMVFLIVRTFIGMISPHTETPLVVATNVAPLTQKARVIDVALSAQSHEALLSALQNQPKPGTGVVEFRILEASGVPMTGNSLWNTFGFSPNPTVSRSITDARLGYSNGDSLLVLKVSDAVTMFGALLAWEKDMPREFSSLFMKNGSAPTTVRDETIAGSDVRVLLQDNEPVLVYGFITKNVVIITESLDAYKAVVEGE